MFFSRLANAIISRTGCRRSDRQRALHQHGLVRAEIGGAELRKVPGAQARLAVERGEGGACLRQRGKCCDVGQALARETGAAFGVGGFQRALQRLRQRRHVEGLQGRAHEARERVQRSSV